MSHFEISLLSWSIVGGVIAIVLAVIFFPKHFYWIRFWKWFGKKNTTKKSEKKKDNRDFFEKFCEKKEDISKRILKASQDIRLATTMENMDVGALTASIQKQRELLKQEEEIAEKRKKLQEKTKCLPQHKGWVEKNIFTLIFSMIPIAFVVMVIIYFFCGK